MINGVINVYKEKGFTSHDVVAKLRGIVKQKKIGHTGTLDPDATGVLPVCLGNATKLCDMLTDKSKEYVTTMRLGFCTDTQDISGEVLEQKEGNSTLRIETPEEVMANIFHEEMKKPREKRNYDLLDRTKYYAGLFQDDEIYKKHFGKSREEFERI